FELITCGSHRSASLVSYMGGCCGAKESSTSSRRVGGAVSVVEVRKMLQKLLLTTIPVAFSLLLEGPFVEVEKVSRHKGVWVSSCEVSSHIVFSQPRLSNKHRSIFPLDRDHRVVKLDLKGKKLLQIRPRQRIAVGENHQIRLCSWR